MLGANELAAKRTGECLNLLEIVHTACFCKPDKECMGLL